MSDVMCRVEFVYFFDAKDSNPNGDPDLVNQPRTDPETGHGIVSPECLKRKVRNFVDLSFNNTAPNEIYIRSGNVLNELHDEVSKEDGPLGHMCGRFYDVRAFGAVMTTGKNPIGVVRGPIQLTFSRSIDRVEISTHALTRCCVTTSKDSGEGKVSTFGAKPVVNYGLYRMHGFFNPHLAAKFGFGEEDLELFFKALLGMWELDRSAIRSQVDARRLVVFKHSSPLGCAPSHKLLERVSCRLINDPPRSFGDYEIQVDSVDLPAGVTIEELL